MPPRQNPILHRDDPDKEPLTGHVKVTRQDWLNVARDILVKDGVASVKILPISDRLNVSRSSFYWYFKSRQHLLDALLGDWEQQNTQSIVTMCARPSRSICEGVCNFFRCFIDPASFDQGLDFAVREWSRRDTALRNRIDAADQTRLAALTDMYERHDFTPAQADARARILYFMQLGYHALEVNEPMDQRMSRLESYLEGFTGQPPDMQAVTDFRAFSATFA